MKRWGLVLVGLLLLPALVSGQPVSQWPSVGELIWRSPERLGLSDGCILAYSTTNRKLFCASPRLVSANRPPESFNLNTASPPTLDCQASGCALVFPDAGAVAGVDWIMPSVPLVGSSLVLTWNAATTGGTVGLKVDWCRYRVGEAPCTPSGANAITAYTPNGAGSGKRNDTQINPFSPDWQPGDQVVLYVERLSSGLDTVAVDVRLTGMRLEWTQE